LALQGKLKHSEEVYRMLFTEASKAPVALPQ
jgi:hypothetical protein